MDDANPCWVMGSRLSAFCDGSLPALARWYARLHVSCCPQCAGALAAFRKVRERLLRHREAVIAREGTGLTSDRWKALELAWAAAERDHR
jgi:hypothetical protein